MMKYLFPILLLNCLLISTVSARNCAQAVHNPHCSGSSGHSGHHSQGSTVTGSAGQTPDPAKANSHLGSGTQTQQTVVQIEPIVPYLIVGQAQAPAKPGMKIPPVPETPIPPIIQTATPPLLKTPASISPIQVYTVPPLVVTGTYAVPPQPISIDPPKSFTSPPQLQVYAVPGQVVTGQSAVPPQPISIDPPRSFTSPPQLQVYAVPGQVITGQSAVPPQPISIDPPKIFTSPPDLQVYAVPGQVITGQSAVPPQPISIDPPKNFTSPPDLQVYAVPGQVITGQSVVPPQPISIDPPKNFTSPPDLQVYAVPGQVITGQSAVPPQPISIDPPKSFTSPPQLQIYSIPTPIQATQAPSKLPNIVPPGSSSVAPTQKNQHTTTPVLITHVASSNLHPDVLLQQQMLHGSADLKTLEPHIKDLSVDVYTDKNVRRMAYKESASTDSKGFHLTVVGVKQASFADTRPLPVPAKSDDIIFNFSFASADIHKNQLTQIDKIIDKHSKNGKRIVLMGETDGFGSEDYNKHLAILRANKIIDALKARGVKIDDIEIRILVRCCRKDHPNKETLAETSEQRITWVHFQ